MEQKQCVDNKHLSKAKARFPRSIWFNEYFFEDYFAFTMVPFPTFRTLCHDVFWFFLYVFLKENISAYANTSYTL